MSLAPAPSAWRTRSSRNRGASAAAAGAGCTESGCITTRIRQVGKQNVTRWPGLTSENLTPGVIEGTACGRVLPSPPSAERARVRGFVSLCDLGSLRVRHQYKLQYDYSYLGHLA